MKLNIELNMNDIFDESTYDFEEDFKTSLIENVSKQIADKVMIDRHSSSWHDFETKVKYYAQNKIDEFLEKNKDYIINKLIERVESKRDYQERVFKVKPFSEVTKENEEYLNELVDKAIARRFGK